MAALWFFSYEDSFLTGGFFSRESERGKNDTPPRFLKESNKNVCFGSPSAPKKKIVTQIPFGFINGISDPSTSGECFGDVVGFGVASKES